MPRIARIVVRDYPYHVIQRGNNKQTVFFDDRDKKLYLQLLNKFRKEDNCKLHAYCLMNNHIHLLITPLKDESLSKMMQKLSLRYTQLINKKYKRTGRLWECRFHSCLIDKDNYLWAVCRYIETNPVRANIVKSVRDYFWSSARINVLGEESNLVEPIWGGEKDKLEYSKFVLESEDKLNKEIKNCTYKGKPLGDEGFMKIIEKLLNIDLSIKKVGRPKQRMEE